VKLLCAQCNCFLHTHHNGSGRYGMKNRQLAPLKILDIRRISCKSGKSSLDHRWLYGLYRAQHRRLDTWTLEEGSLKMTVWALHRTPQSLLAERPLLRLLAQAVGDDWAVNPSYFFVSLWPINNNTYAQSRVTRTHARTYTHMHARNVGCATTDAPAVSTSPLLTHAGQ
jgi:hypothetical protein